LLKKRLIFTLLYNEGKFALSRNFRLQNVGDINWLLTNYNFKNISFYVDELVILNVTKNKNYEDNFCDVISILNLNTFVPISAGGGIRTLDYANKILKSGADRIIINTVLFSNLDIVKSLSENFGAQCIVGSVDLKIKDNLFKIYTNGGNTLSELDPTIFLKELCTKNIGELYMNSIDHDGTGNGYNFKMLEIIPADFKLPIIIAGGVGHDKHLIEGLRNPIVNAAATAHLFNFVGDGLKRARKNILLNNINLASWPDIEEVTLKNIP